MFKILHPGYFIHTPLHRDQAYILDHGSGQAGEASGLACASGYPRHGHEGSDGYQLSNEKIPGCLGHMDVSKNGGAQQPWVFLLKMIILGCFGGTTIFGNIHIVDYTAQLYQDFSWLNKGLLVTCS